MKNHSRFYEEIQTAKFHRNTKLLWWAFIVLMVGGIVVVNLLGLQVNLY